MINLARKSRLVLGKPDKVKQFSQKPTQAYYFPSVDCTNRGPAVSGPSCPDSSPDTVFKVEDAVRCAIRRSMRELVALLRKVVTPHRGAPHTA